MPAKVHAAVAGRLFRPMLQGRVQPDDETRLVLERVPSSGFCRRSVLVEAGRWSRSPSRNTEPTVLRMSIAGLLACCSSDLHALPPHEASGSFRWCCAVHAARTVLTSNLASWLLAIEVCGIPGRDLPPPVSLACSLPMRTKAPCLRI